MDGCQTPWWTPLGNHKENYTDKKATCSMLFLGISDTKRIHYFIGGFPGSRVDFAAFRSGEWYKAMHQKRHTSPPTPARPFRTERCCFCPVGLCGTMCISSLCMPDMSRGHTLRLFRNMLHPSHPIAHGDSHCRPHCRTHRVEQVS